MAGAAPPIAPLPAPRTRRLDQPWLWRVQALLSAYLPLLLMAVLAAGTWWLVKNTPHPDAPTVAAPPRHEPDYQMHGFELQRFSQSGQLSVRIAGAELRHYPDTDTLEIDSVQVHAEGADGRLTVASAKRAVSNADGSEMQLQGDVWVRHFAKGQDAGTPQLEVRGEFLHALLAQDKLRSHLPVTVKTARGEFALQSFVFDKRLGSLDFAGRSTARFQSR